MHPLSLKKYKPLLTMELKTPFVSVTGEVKKKVITIEDSSINIAKPGTKFAKLPTDFKVVDSNGDEIPTTGSYYISTETIDPHHLIIDYTPTF